MLTTVLITVAVVFGLLFLVIKMSNKKAEKEMLVAPSEGWAFEKEENKVIELSPEQSSEDFEKMNFRKRYPGLSCGVSSDFETAKRLALTEVFEDDLKAGK